MLKKSARFINRVLWTSLVFVLVLGAVYVSLGRYYVQYIEQYQQVLVDQFVQFSGLHVEVGNISAQWSGISPVLVVDELSLYFPEQPEEAIFSVGALELKPDVLTSLRRQTFQINRLNMHTAKIKLEEVSPGQWKIRGIPKTEGKTNLDNLVDLFLSIRAIDITDIKIDLDFYNKTQAVLTGKELLLQRDGDFRRIRAAAQFNSTPNQLQLLIEAEGDPRDLDDFSARTYIKFDNIDLSPHVPVFKSLGVELTEASLDGEVWGVWNQESQSVQARLATPFLDLAAISGADISPLKNLEFNVLAERNKLDGTKIWLSNIKANWFEQEFKFEQVEFSDDKGAYIFSLPRLDIESSLKKIVATGVVKEKEKSILSTLKPKGTLENIQLLLSRDEGAGGFQLRANLLDVSVKAWKGTPEVSHVNGYLQVGSTNGMVELDTKQFHIGFPNIYKNNMTFNKAKARIEWSIDKTKERVFVNSGPIELEAMEGNATALLKLDLPLHAGMQAPPKMNLMVGLKHSQATYRNKYIPSLVLSDGLVSWLDRSIQSGDVSDGGFIFRGSLLKSDHNRRTVQLHLNISKGKLDYHSEWPGVDSAKAVLFLNDDNLDVFIDQATVHGLSVNDAVVKLRKREGALWLSVGGVAKGTGNNALGFLNDSAVRKTIGDVLESWSLSGDVSAELDLSIPLNSPKNNPDINVIARLNGNTLNLPNFQLFFDELDGELSFTTKSGLFSSGLAAKFFNKKVQADIYQNKKDGLVFSAAGKIDMRDVQQWTSQQALMFVSGKTDFKARLSIKPDENVLKIHSDMKGVAIDLPVPYKKVAGEILGLDMSLNFNSESQFLDLKLTDKASIELQFKNQNFNRGVVMLAGVHGAKAEENKIVITGYSPSADLGHWQPVIERYVAAIGGDDRAQDPSAVELEVKDLLIKNLTLFDADFDDVTFGAKKNNSGWRFLLENKKVDVRFLMPDEQDLPFQIVFNKLALESKNAGGYANRSISHFDGYDESIVDFKNFGVEEAGLLAGINPTKIDDMDVVIKQLYFDDDWYGDLSFNLRSDDKGFRLNKLLGEIRGIRVGSKKQPAFLSWLVEEGKNKSKFNGELSFGDLSQVLEKWNYNPEVESKNGFLNLSLTWSGRPDNWSLVNTEGHVKIGIYNGLFKTTSKTASGTLKVISILNLTNILRRLQLDFSDLFKGGVSFDKVEGDVELADGQLFIVDEFRIKSPSSLFLISGDTHLDTEVLDMEMVATLPIGSNLPWVVAIVGGLPAAAGVYVASKVFKKQLDKLSSLKYKMNGTWSDPELVFNKVFDDSKKKRDLHKNKMPVDVEKNKLAPAEPAGAMP